MHCMVRQKCELFQQEIKFLGHVVTPKGVKCDPEKTKAVEDWPMPTNVTQIRSFLGLVSYYRRFIPKCATIASPLTRLTKKHARFVWSEECETAFKQLKSLLLSADVGSYPQGKGNFILDTDASDINSKDSPPPNHTQIQPCPTHLLGIIHDPSWITI